MVRWGEQDHRPGDAWSLGQFYALVPDAYDLDLFEDARVAAAAPFEDARENRLVDEILRQVDAEDLDVAGTAPSDPVAEDVAAPAAPLSPTQAQFMVERLLGGEVLDESHG